MLNGPQHKPRVALNRVLNIMVHNLVILEADYRQQFCLWLGVTHVVITIKDSKRLRICLLYARNVV